MARLPTIAILAASLGGCGFFGAEGPPHPPARGSDGDSDGSSGDDGSSGSTGGVTSDSDTSSTTGATSTTSTTSTGTSTTGSGSTGGVCGGLGTTGNSTGSTDPWLEVTHQDAPVQNGSDLNLACGGQGFLMFELFFWFGGFDPDGEFVPMEVQLDVPGYNTGPNDYFYSYVADFYVGCNSPEPYHSFPLFPPDDIQDPTVLDGVPGALSIVLDTPSGLASFEADIVLAVDQSMNWANCIP